MPSTPSHEYIEAPVGFCFADRSSETGPSNAPPVDVAPVGAVAVGPVAAVPPGSTSVSPLEHAPRSTIAKIEAAGTRLRARRTSEFVYR